MKKKPQTFVKAYTKIPYVKTINLKLFVITYIKIHSRWIIGLIIKLKPQSFQKKIWEDVCVTVQARISYTGHRDQ